MDTLLLILQSDDHRCSSYNAVGSVTNVRVHDRTRTKGAVRIKDIRIERATRRPPIIKEALTTKWTKQANFWIARRLFSLEFFGVLKNRRKFAALCVYFRHPPDYELNSHSDSLSSFLLIHFCSNVLWRPAFWCLDGDAGDSVRFRQFCLEASLSML